VARAQWLDPACDLPRSFATSLLRGISVRCGAWHVKNSDRRHWPVGYYPFWAGPRVFSVSIESIAHELVFFFVAMPGEDAPTPKLCGRLGE